MFSTRRLLTKSKSILALWNKAYMTALSTPMRFYSGTVDVQAVDDQKSVESMTEEEKIALRNQKFGADVAFNSRKHGYILSLPWNFDEVIKDYEQDFRVLKPNNFWHRWVFNRECNRDFDELFRVFHQSCAIPEESGIDRVCEPRLAAYMKKAIQNVHFHGMDIEMANLTNHSPKIDILNVDVSYGISVDRDSNKPKDDYNVAKSTFWGCPLSVYTDKNDTRSVFDSLDKNYKPYLVSVTAIIHSPMKLYVWNQNKTKILFGSNDKEIVKNVVKFEANVRWTEFFRILPVQNKPLLGRDWKIVDYNNVMNENPHFQD